MKFSVSWQQTKEKKTRKKSPGKKKQNKNLPQESIQRQSIDWMHKKGFNKKLNSTSRAYLYARCRSLFCLVHASETSVAPNRTRREGEKKKKRLFLDYGVGFVAQEKATIVDIWRTQPLNRQCVIGKSHNSGNKMNPTTKSPPCNFFKSHNSGYITNPATNSSTM